MVPAKLISSRPIELVSRAPRHLIGLIAGSAGLAIVAVFSVETTAFWKTTACILIVILAGSGIIRLLRHTEQTYLLHPRADRWQRLPLAEAIGDPVYLEFISCPFRGRRWVVIRARDPGSDRPVHMVFFRRHNDLDSFRRLRVWLQQ